MTPEHDRALCAAYPLLYEDRHKPATETCMCWGFACGDGWYEIIDAMSARLETLIAQDPTCGVRASQVKEKFGTLRVYLEGAVTAPMEEAVASAELKSMSTCETCGSQGRLRIAGYIKVTCDSCWSPE